MPWLGLETRESLSNGFQSFGQAPITFELLEML